MDYYRIRKEELGLNAAIPVSVLGQAGEVFYEAALAILSEIEEKNARGRRSVFIVPVGPTGQYPILARLVNERRTSLKRTWFFNMDEYLGPDGAWIDLDHPLSFRSFMEKNFYSRIDPSLVMPPEQRIFPDPAQPQALDALLESLGGADLCCGGIGINGHLAFNEPEDMDPADFARLPTRVVRIAPETRAINAGGDLGGALEDMPKLGVTIGMRQILGSKKLRLYCFRDWHRGAVRRAAYGAKTASFPASLAQGHPDARITISENAAHAAY